MPFRLAASPGRGWGAFATRKIAAGSVIAREAALFTIPKPHALIEDRDIRAALSTLPPGSRQQFYSLRDNGDAEFHYLIDAFCENCFRVPSSSSVTYDSAHRFGCYILLSRINHSCIPNAKIPDSNIEGTSIACFATRDIEEGEEITFCYNTDFMCRTSRDRHRELRFVCECKACRSGTTFHRLSEMRRTMIRGLQYLLHGKDFDGKRGPQVVFEVGLRRKAEKFDIGAADRLVYIILTMVLLEQEGLLDRFMLERMQCSICHLIMALKTPDNITIVEEIMTKKAWDERLGACLRLWGRVDAGDEALRSQLKRIDSMRR